jgi:putative transposase
MTYLKTLGFASDQTIEFTGLLTGKICPIGLGRIGYRDTATGKHYVFLIDIFKLSAKAIADIYTSRWQVELLFKWIKQNLKIKSFIGTSKNAVMTQMWVAIRAYLILAFLKLQSKSNKSSQQILRVLQLNLFEKRDLMTLVRGDPVNHQSYNSSQFSLQ